MSVPAAVINEVKTWLNSQHIKVPSNWVEACVKFLIQEYQMQFEKGSLQNLKNCVYEQWLSADLQEIAIPCLPSDLVVSQKTILQGCYTLQVNGVRDVGKSAYGQLKQLGGVSNENAEVSATPKAFVPEWEAKPTRMLMMNLTDGISCIQGMEYRPIPFISVDLPAGVKVVIQGPVDCRFGVLLLTAEKIRVLGGEVEYLVQKYSKEEILRDVLQSKSENDEPVENGLVENHCSVESNTMQNTRNTFHQVPQPLLSGISSRSSGASVGLVDTYSHPQVNTRNTNPDFEDVNNTEDLDFDSFENDDDDDAFIKNLDYETLELIEKQRTSLAVPENEDFEISEDEEVYREVMAFQKNTEVDVTDCYMQAQSKTSSPVTIKVPVSTQNISSPTQFRRSSSPKTWPSVDQKASSVQSISAKTSLSHFSNVTSSAQAISLSSVKPSKSYTPEFSPSVNKKAAFTSSTASSVNTHILSASSATSAVKNPVLCSSVTSSSPLSQKVPARSCAEVRPYSCLSSILQDLDSSSEFTVTIKASISHVLSRLNCLTTTGWDLSVKLDDGTATTETTIHDKVLEEFIGISAKDMVGLQVQARSDAAVAKKIMEALANCKRKLQSLNCLMQVKFSPGLSKPCVIKCFS